MTDADPRALERVGAILNEKWTLERLLGVGGMGAVYAGRHRNGARAAVKVLHPDLARQPAVRERFLREGYAANRVEHRGAVQVLDDDIVKDGADEGSAYLVMELLEGESLDDRADRDPKLGERDILEIMDAVLDVLAAAHQHGVIHRDLKPENIFLAKDPDRDGVRVKVLDFGLARLAEAGTVTSAGLALGTPSFMSPEQAAGSAIDGRTDIFALGATAFRIITERRIHDASNLVALVVKMATQPAPRLRTIASDVSEPFARVVDRALAFERDDRYPDASAMQADVRAALAMLEAGETATVQVIPFSARNVPTAEMAALEIGERATVPSDRPPPKSPPPPPPKTEAPEPEPVSEPPPSARSREASTVERPRSSVLPFLFVAAALGLIGWRFGPSIQAELVRRASVPAKTVEPAAPTTTTISAPIDVADAAPTIELEAGPAAIALDDAGTADDDDGGADDSDVDASVAELTTVRDASAPSVTSARPRPAGHPSRPPRRPGHPRKRRR